MIYIKDLVNINCTRILCITCKHFNLQWVPNTKGRVGDPASILVKRDSYCCLLKQETFKFVCSSYNQEDITKEICNNVSVLITYFDSNNAPMGELVINVDGK